MEWLKNLWNALFGKKAPVQKPVVVESPAEALEAPELEGPLHAEIGPALKFTLANEGGFSDHPNDKGGPTKKGITIGRLSEYLGRPATKQEVKDLDDKTIELIYKKYYWDVLNLDRVVDQEIATAIFDMGVLCGTGTAAKWAQEICHVEADKKIGTITLGVLNKLADTEFIPKFADKAQDYFNAIVAKNPSQKVFLKGWTNRANKLRTLPNGEKHEDLTPQAINPDKIGGGLVEVGAKAGLKVSYIEEMIAKHKKFKPGSNPRYWVLFEIKKHSKNKRMHIFDRLNGTVETIFGVHGEGSDRDHDGLATVFSNVPNSHTSSLGYFTTSGTYNMAKHGLALRLVGHEITNNKALERGIVFHGVPYANEAYVKANGKCGRSWGCPAVDYAMRDKYVEKLKGGSPFYIV